ncbi:Altered inheritance of mitochondria protein 42 [Cladobotryum mycophilum]|uniref:Altered inheritance of mitochondria protein 42 n=1 Tax=Cladobotryum mycophilum TaxID=491253 RepID=A0ABR0T2N8_9HYPO
MAGRRATQQLLLRRMSARPSIGAAASSSNALRRACSAATGSSSALRPAASLGLRGEARLGGVRWYSAKNENQIPNSRIWNFDEIKKLVETSDVEEKVVIVDVREPGELLQTGIIPGAINIPITTAVQSFHVSEQDFQDMYGFERPPKDANLLFYCRAGVRARAAAGLAQHAGWTSVGEYPGSWLDWETHQGPVEKVGQGKSGGQE